MQKEKIKRAKTNPKISKLARTWKVLKKDSSNYDKQMDFYEAFLNTNFWLKLDPSEEKNYTKFKKRGIKKGEKFKVAFATDNTLPLFESLSEHKKFAEKGLKKGEKIVYESIKQHGGEVIFALPTNTNYSIKIKGIRDFVRIYPENVTFMKKSFKQ